ncbi:hypothetical protein PMIN03_008393 [Paraphaeosphaeria minitans]
MARVVGSGGLLNINVGVAASSSFYRRRSGAAPLPLKAERRHIIATRAEGRQGITFNPSPFSGFFVQSLYLRDRRARYILSCSGSSTPRNAAINSGQPIHHSELFAMSSDTGKVLSKTVWQAQPAQVAVTDKIIVRNLQASVDAGVDVWGRPRKQRALLTVSLSLTKPFDSAAQADALDDSTVHYGVLSKAIQAHVDSQAGRLGTGQLAQDIFDVVRNTAGVTPLASIEVAIFYPKGSMFGDGAEFSLGKSLPEEKMYIQLHVRNVRIPCLIGVNANERQQKQPVIVNLWVDCLAAHRHDDYQKLETIVFDVVSSSSFETLESLTTTVMDHLRSNFFTDTSDDRSSVRLQIEKPHAVPAADAPVIEIVRPVRV